MLRTAVKKDDMMEAAPLMELQAVSKTFPNGTVALRGVDLTILPGRVHGLLGANGAGKSTLIKILSGAYPATGGTIIWRGAQQHWSSPKEANDIGVATIHQHIPLAQTLTVLENVVLRDGGFWRRSARIRKHFTDLCDQVGYWIDPDAIAGSLSIGQRQMVAIFQALNSGADLIVMDEPTASLAVDERELVYSIVRHLSAVEGKAILFVSHFLDEVMALTQDITVLRDGKAVLSTVTEAMSESQLAEAIVGKQIIDMEQAAHVRRPRPARQPGAVPLLELRDLASPGRLARTTLKVDKGEVLGIAGLLGSGRSELLHAIFRADERATGQVLLEGQPVALSTAAAVRAGMGIVPEDRMGQGLFGDFEIWRNTTMPGLAGVSALGIFPKARAERSRARDSIAGLSIKAHSPDTLVSDLSGGNAQKVTIGKWLFSGVKLFLLDEPTAGIDIGAKADILRLVRRLAADGATILVVSSEFEELMAVADRILVMRDGAVIAERAVQDTTEHELLLLAAGQDLARK